MSASDSGRLGLFHNVELLRGPGIYFEAGEDKISIRAGPAAVTAARRTWHACVRPRTAPGYQFNRVVIRRGNSGPSWN